MFALSEGEFLLLGGSRSCDITNNYFLLLIMSSCNSLAIEWIVMRSPEELVKSFREQGKKVTPQRQRIFQILQDNDTHPTAESVHAELVRDLSTVSLKTVYQTLHELVDMGEISPLDLGTGSSRFDPNRSKHHHLVCTRCHSVKDLYFDIGEVRIPEEQLCGFTAGEAEVTFRGVCARCMGEGADRVGNQMSG